MLTERVCPDGLNHVIITNEKGRLLLAEIERTAHTVDRYRDDVEVNKAKMTQVAIWIKCLHLVHSFAFSRSPSVFLPWPAQRLSQQTTQKDEASKANIEVKSRFDNCRVTVRNTLVRKKLANVFEA